MKMSERRGRVAGRPRMSLWGAVAIASLVLAGCASEVADNNANSGAGGSETVVEALKPVTEVDAPTETFDPPRDKHILILMCGSAGQGCVNEGNESKAVAESLGWTVDLVDGKFDPTVWNQTVKHAAELGIDGIISISGDPNLMAEAMGIVQQKDIPFVLTNQFPADDDIKGVDTYIGPDPVHGGNDIAEWIVADSDGKANVLLIDAPGYYSIRKRTQAINAALKDDCTKCVIDSVDLSAATMGTTLAPSVTSRLQQNPGIDYVVVPDDCCVSFVNQGIQQAGRASTTKVISVGGFAEQLTALRDGGPMDADLATPNRYMGWLSVDTLARLMAGLPTQRYWAAPQRLWTAANIDESSDEAFKLGWNLDFDYKPMFQKMWAAG